MFIKIFYNNKTMDNSKICPVFRIVKCFRIVWNG